MVLVNTPDGRTHRFDPSKADQFAALRSFFYENEISGVALLVDGIQHAMPLPKRFKTKPVYGIELLKSGDDTPLGARLYVHADDVRASLTTTGSRRLVRYDLVRIGTMQYNADRSRL